MAVYDSNSSAFNFKNQDTLSTFLFLNLSNGSDMCLLFNLLTHVLFHLLRAAAAEVGWGGGH